MMRFKQVAFFLFPQLQFDLAENDALALCCDEVWLSVLRYLRPFELLVVMRVCRDLYRLCNDASLWRPSEVFGRPPMCLLGTPKPATSAAAAASVVATPPVECDLQELCRLEYVKWLRSPARSSHKPLGNLHVRTNQYEYDILLKIVIVGESGIGKTSFHIRSMSDTFPEPYGATIGIDFKVRTVSIGDLVVKIQFWDTAGQERFRSITSAYYRGARVVVVAFDITDRHSFDMIAERWMPDISRYAADDIAIIMIGTKSDLESQRAVSRQEAEEYASSVSCPYMECSARTRDGVEEALMAAVHSGLQGSVCVREENNPFLLKQQIEERERARPLLSRLLGW